MTELMAPGPETDSKQEEGYLFSGPTNNMQQGLPVPVCYGELLVGGAPMSVSFRPEIMSQYGSNFGAKIVSYGVGPVIPYSPFVETTVDVAVPNDNNEFEVAA